MNIAESALVTSHGVHEESKFAGMFKINKSKLNIRNKNCVTKIRQKLLHDFLFQVIR